MKRFLLVFFLLAGAPFVMAQGGNCVYTLELAKDNTKSTLYTLDDIAQFVQVEVLPRFSRIDSDFDINIYRKCGAGAKKKTVIQMQTESLYLTKINDVALKNEKECPQDFNYKYKKELHSLVCYDLSTYSEDGFPISKAALISAIDHTFTFPQTIKNPAPADFVQMHKTLKLLAFFLAEAARFEVIDHDVRKVMAEACQPDWVNYKSLVRSWKKISIFANDEKLVEDVKYVGGTGALLFAPIKNVWAAKYDALEETKELKLDSCPLSE